jgi:hypothetical protein
MKKQVLGWAPLFGSRYRRVSLPYGRPCSEVPYNKVLRSKVLRPMLKGHLSCRT